MGKVNQLVDIQNKYPESKPVDSNYINGKLVGEIPSNTINLPKEEFLNIKEIPGEFNTIISLDGELYASRDYLKKLKETNNPYITLDTVPILYLTTEELKSDTDFSNFEKYSEVEVTKTIDTTEDILEHLAWLLNPQQKEIRKVSSYGQYQLKTTTYNIEEKSGLGFEYSDLIENMPE